MLDRPWAKIWEEYFEKNMERPKEGTRTWVSNKRVSRRNGNGQIENSD